MFGFQKSPTVAEKRELAYLAGCAWLEKKVRELAPDQGTYISGPSLEALRRLASSPPGSELDRVWVVYQSRNWVCEINAVAERKPGHYTFVPTSITAISQSTSIMETLTERSSSMAQLLTTRFGFRLSVAVCK